jgi:hypothetical protein
MTLSLTSSSTRKPIDRALASVLWANMLEAWLDAQPELPTTVEGIDESEDQRKPPKQTRLHAATTRAKDRKRMLRLLIKDITVEKLTDTRQLSVHIRW